MPELPEVETLCRQLNAILPGKEILNVEILDPRLGKMEALAGRRVAAVTRRGKFIEIDLDGGLKAVLHLRMTGRLLWQGDGASLPPYSRLVVSFPRGRLVLIDPRRFAIFCVRPENVPGALIQNPLEGLPARRLREIARTRRLPVKSFLMDQRLIAGIGNIYACEILHEAAVDPRRPAGSLSPAEWRRVERAAAVVLPRAVECRGTTVSDWRDLFGVSGTNQDHLEVYSREAEPCSRCGGRIERAKMGGRGTWFCPACQK
ncbi:MAG: DNA-formamidopyrimidine glycosylase [Deltaproteobacteria bacterium RBG_16_58_17]|nr:MAG: DNA-formamidopyrimidine glycosylase [Deltaproteobacteria bacterium RBG_16_58_17]